MRKTMLTTVIFGAAVLLSPAAPAAVVDNFETYAAGSSLAANGYTSFLGGGPSIVYPNPGGPGPAFPALEGAQSVSITGHLFHGRGWGAAASEVGDGATLSWLVKQEVAASGGQTQFFLSDNAGTGGGGTRGGIILDHATSNVHLHGLGGATSTPFTYAATTVYLFEMELDFISDTFTGYVTDITNAGPRTLLGVKAFTTDLNAATVAANGGVLFGNWAGGSAAAWDDIQIAIPEPSSMVLFGLGGLMVFWRR